MAYVNQFFPLLTATRHGEALGQECAVEPFRASSDPEVMSKVRPPFLWFNRRALREGEPLHAALTPEPVTSTPVPRPVLQITG